ncbi:putative hydrolase YtnL [Synergistales bacterium]|nr:putative hydrolase YtnL [Synergistales bacterium]
MDKNLLQNKLEEYFAWFHSHPELSWEERETSARIRGILTDTGIRAKDSRLDTGVIAEIGGSRPGRTIALRADIDALPITEASGSPYTSLNGGRMHACGHDFHTTALLGAAALLYERRASLAGTVRLLFQPAEEDGGGARKIIEAGGMEEVSEVYGLHVHAENAPGVIALCAGADHASVDRFRLHIKGRGGHAARPHDCADPIVALAQFINAAQCVVSRLTNPFDRAVLSVTRVTSGNTWNVIPDEAFAEGTLRTLDIGTRERALRRLSDICEAASISCGVRAEIENEAVTLPTDNDPALCEFVAAASKGLGLVTETLVPDMIGEDFAYYQRIAPGVFFSVGVGSDYALHNPSFRADISPLSDASRLLAAIAESRADTPA